MNGAAADCVDQNVDGAEFLRHRVGDGVNLDRVEHIGALRNGATAGRPQRRDGVIEPRLDYERCRDMRSPVFRGFPSDTSKPAWRRSLII